MKTPAPNPAAFDGHWLTPRHMAELAGIGAKQLASLDRQGKLGPGASVRVGGRGERRYDAGKVLAARKPR